MKHNNQPQIHYGAIDDKEQAAPPGSTEHISYVKALICKHNTAAADAGSLLAIVSICSLSIRNTSLLDQCIQDQQNEAPSTADGGEEITLSQLPAAPTRSTTIPAACQHYDKSAVYFFKRKLIITRRVLQFFR